MVFRAEKTRNPCADAVKKKVIKTIALTEERDFE